MEDVYNRRHSGIDDKFPKRIHPATCTSDGLLTAEDKCKLNAIDLDDWKDRVYDNATHEADGLMSKEDKIKLDTVEEKANNYIHPDTINIRHVTDKEKEYWNAKASTAIVTINVNGLMSAVDKKKLDAIEAEANKYIHPNTPLIRHVTDVQISYWNDKASTALATQSSNGLMSAADKTKLDEIEEKANNYIHPNNKSTRHVTDAEKDYWTDKASKDRSTPTEDGLMSFIDKKKLDNIEDGAIKYIHPDTTSIRHVTDAEKATWNGKADRSVATHTISGLMSYDDKEFLDSVKDMNLKIDNATPIKDGLMSKKDKSKLDSIMSPIEDSAILGIGSWSNTAPYTQTISLTNFNPVASASGYIGINVNATKEQFDAALKAELSIKSVGEGQITVQAKGIKPTIEIPIIIMFGSSIVVIQSKGASLEYSNTIPTSGTYYAGNIVYSSSPNITECLGWVCIESGTPGKWKKIGITSA